MKTKEEELDLIRRILGGEEKALYQFWRFYTPKIFAFIRSKVHRNEDGEEILQDTLLSALEGLRDFEGRCMLSTYLCAIAYHKIIDYYRRQKVKQIVFSQLPDGVGPLISAFLGPEEQFNAQEVEERIRMVFNQLKPHYQQILTMKYIEGLPVAQIARTLSTTFKSAESTLFRARMAFVELYSKL